jgi:hypothetical protein
MIRFCSFQEGSDYHWLLLFYWGHSSGHSLTNWLCPPHTHRHTPSTRGENGERSSFGLLNRCPLDVSLRKFWSFSGPVVVEILIRTPCVRNLGWKSSERKRRSGIIMLRSVENTEIRVYFRQAVRGHEDVN